MFAYYVNHSSVINSIYSKKFVLGYKDGWIGVYSISLNILVKLGCPVKKKK